MGVKVSQPKFLRIAASKIFGERDTISQKDFNQLAAIRLRTTKEESKILKSDLISFEIVDVFGHKNSQISISPSLNNTSKKSKILDFRK